MPEKFIQLNISETLFPYFMRHRNVLLLLFFIAGLSTRIAARDSTEVNLYRINNISPEHIIANVGGIKITADEFINGYEFGPAFIKRQKDSKRKYMDFMIYEKLLAIEGYNKKYDDSEDVKQFLSEIQNDLATEQLYMDSIWSKVKVTESAIRLAMDQDNIELEMKWIFKPGLDEIRDQVNELNRGVPFDTLFNKQFNDTVSYDDRYLKTSRFKLSKINPVLASITDTLKVGNISLPIKTADGYYIIKIADVWQNVINTETEANDKYYSMEKYLTKQKADSASDIYVDKILSNEKPVIVRLTFNILKSYLAKKLLHPDKYSEWNTIKNITLFIPDFKVNEIGKYLNSTLIRMDKDSVVLEEFMNWYTNREPYIKYNLKSHQEFNISLQNIVWKMLRDNLLAKVAQRNNYNNSPEVVRQLKWWKDKLVYSKLKLDIAQDIKIKPDAVKKYYDEHKKDYLNEKRELKDFDEVKKDIWNDMYVQEYTKKIVNKVLSLKNRYKINIDELTLAKLKVNEEYNPRAIEMYTVKKGGTLVRPVYPTIDYEWQFWN